LLLLRPSCKARPLVAALLASCFVSTLSAAAVNYTLTGSLSLTSGTDPLGANGATMAVLVAIDSAKAPSAFVTTASSSGTIYQNPPSTRFRIASRTIQTCANPGVTFFLTDNVSKTDAFVLSGCSFQSSVFAVNVSVPGGSIVTAVPASFPRVAVIASVAYTTPGSSARTVFSLKSATLVATGAAPPTVTPSPISWSPSVVQGSTASLSQRISLGASAPVSYKTSVSGESWLGVQPAVGNTSTSLTLTANPTGLLGGDYTASVILDSGQGIAYSLPVKFTITPMATVVVSPSSLTFSSVAAGTSPPSQSLTITSSPAAELPFTVSTSHPWFSVAPGSGGTPSSLNVSVNTAGLAIGTLTGIATITASGAANTPISVPVILVLSPPSGYYVDSVYGNDLNSGVSEPLAKATIGALPVLEDGDTVNLARGSYWREQLDNQMRSNITVQAYGVAGRLPILDASDVLVNATFAPNATYPVVYETIWTDPAPDSLSAFATSVPSIWENGVLLKRVATLLLCSTTPGSFYATNTHVSGDTITVYFQASDASDARLNGRTYESAVRRSGLALGDGAIVRDIHTRRNASYLGSLKAGRFSLIEGSLAESGNVHNVLIGSGIVRDTIAWKADPLIAITGSGGAMFVNYHTAPGSPRDSMLWERVKAVMNPGDQTTSQVGGWTGHGSPQAFGTVTWDNCEAYYLNGGFGVGDNTDAIVVRNSLAYETNVAVSITTPTVTIDRLEWYITQQWGTYIRGIATSVVYDARPTLTITNYIALIPPNAVAIWTNGGVVLNLSQMTLYRIGASAGSNGVYINAGVKATTSVLTLNHNVFGNWALASNDNYYAFTGSSAVTLTSNYNVFDNTQDAGYKGHVIMPPALNYVPITAYRTAQPTQDVNSQLGLPGWLGDPTARDYRLNPTGKAGLLGAGADPTVKTVDYAAMVDAIAAE
jgi:hypothetical protein